MYITYVIIAITVAISLYAFKEQRILEMLIMNPYVTDKNRQYHRFISSGFIHQDHMHLIFNMFSLFFFGRSLEMVFAMQFGEAGAWYFILLYLLGIIVSDIPTFLKHRNNPRYNSLGASGGVASVIFAFIIFLPLEDIYLYAALPVPGFILGTLYIIFSWYQGKKSNDSINHDAHLYGAIFGVLFCNIIYPPSMVNFFDQIKDWTLSKF